MSNIFNMLFPELESEIISSPNHCEKIAFKCRCSRSRSIAALKLLGKEELKSILNKEKESKLTCKFCNNIYHIKEDEIRKIISEI